MENALTLQAGIELPILCGAMYPCSNPELVAAVSEAGGLGIVQPLSLVFVHGYDFRQGLQRIRSLTSRPIGLNVIVERSSRRYTERMKAWMDIALEEGVRFFVTSLGDPRWVVEKASAVGGVVYHDVTSRKWAEKGLASGAQGIICVNRRAGGHAGEQSLEELYASMADLGCPLIAAGGLSRPGEIHQALQLGYVGVQLGTRFIATHECTAHQDYKDAIVRSRQQDIVLTEKISGVPVSVIRTPYIEKIGTRANPLVRWLLKHPRFKHWMRLFYSLVAMWKLKRASLEGTGYRDYWQAGQSVEGVEKVERVSDILEEYRRVLQSESAP